MVPISRSTPDNESTEPAGGEMVSEPDLANLPANPVESPPDVVVDMLAC
jgi:hypothetical protein